MSVESSILEWIITFDSTLALVGAFAAVMSSFVATLSAWLAARRHAEAKRRVLEFALTSQKVRRELVKAASDHKIDEAEAKLIIRVIERALVDQARRDHVSIDSETTRFVRDLHPYKSRRVVEDLAREALKLTA